MTDDDDTRTIDMAKSCLSSIVASMADLTAAEEAGEDEKVDEMRQTISEDPLSVQVRGGWHTPGDPDGNAPYEYEILLATGGPALRITGDLDDHNEPDEYPRLQWQDWFKPWTDLDLDSEERAALAAYARCFYFDD